MMKKLLTGAAAVALLAIVAMPVPAGAAEGLKGTTAQTDSLEVSSQYYRRRYYRPYRGYYRPYYGGYGYGYRRPFFPFFW
ncbi:MAG TPA: hypothetical protein VKB08_05225 [Bradyrhizobium sp.]|nr:hypothetical protein [Bradyrhizobium sp.]